MKVWEWAILYFGMLAGVTLLSWLLERAERRAQQRQELRERIGRHTSGLDARAAVREAERILGRAG